jgi:ATP-dependent Lon protease
MRKKDSEISKKVPKHSSELEYDQLTWSCPDHIFTFKSTKELTPLKSIVGQDRAIEAITLGAELHSYGYNVFVSGVSGTGRLTTVKHILDQVSVTRPILYDYCFVHNFKFPDNPTLLKFPKGQGKSFAKAIDDVMIFLKRRIPQLFEEEGFQKTRNSLIADYRASEQSLITNFNEALKPKGFILGQVQNEFGMIEFDVLIVIGKKTYKIGDLDALVQSKKLTKAKAEELANQYHVHRTELENLSRTSMKLMQEFREKINEYDKSNVAGIIKGSLEFVRENYNTEHINQYINAFEQDLLDNLAIFLPGTGNEEDDTEKPTAEDIKAKFGQYSVNVVLDNSLSDSAPVIVETTPSFTNLFGTIEKIFDNRGFWKTDFTQIKSGSLLKADQGYLIVNAMDVLTEPGVWPALKRLLLYGKLEIQSADSYFQISQTLLKPEAIDLNVKVIMIGDADIYHSFYFGEEDFKKIFKVNAEFDYEAPRTGEMIHNYAHFIHQLVEQEHLLHFTPSGVSAVIEWGVRHTSTRQKITMQFSDVADLIRESSYYARKDGSALVEQSHVVTAIKARRKRNDILDEKIKEQIIKGTLMIECTGERIGQINGLTVYDTGLVSFGKPARITASVGIGTSGIINIERESEMSGSIHDKGIMILSGFMRERFAQHNPITMSASIAFEQSYSGIDGDSATAAEVIALMSALTKIPIKQSIAITGSMNQKGDIQAIGGVNEKVMGFFELCQEQGLTGEQGVIIPTQNIHDLMLDPEIIKAVKNGTFHIYAITHIEEAIELMMGDISGEQDEQGMYRNGIFGKAHEILRSYTKHITHLQNTL